MPARSPRRDANLDLLRATAITMVVAYHLIQMSPRPLVEAMTVARFGQYGVDLFFVLSGWLIGGLYWQEADRYRTVDVTRFWLRRALRTIPPYFVALALSWTAVWVQRREPFDWAYLVFAQNYRSEIPFFVVSWSLCIEEHFYLLVPLLLAAAGPSVRKSVWPLACLAVVAPIGRVLESVDGLAPGFGYELTATHLRLEGLILGFAAASLPVWRRDWFARIQANAIPLRAIGFVMLAVAVAVPEAWMYRIGFSALALGFLAVLLSLVGRPPGRLARLELVRKVALASFSIYLTHPLVLHVARRTVEGLPSALWPVYFVVGLALVAGVGSTFYWTIERTSIGIRDRLVARRA